MNSEKRINEVMKGLDGIQQAEVNPFLYNRILNKINSTKNVYASGKLIWLAAASFLILLMLNIGAITKSFSGKQSGQAESQQIASGYNLMNDNSINYN